MVSDVRNIKIHTAELLVPDHNPSKVKIAIAKLRRHKSEGSDQIPAEVIEAGETLLSKMSKLNNSLTYNF
jgi:hypothetical protein